MGKYKLPTPMPVVQEPAKDGGGCFLTTAVVKRRGEADDGPTLTVLRRFRDTYMQETPERRAEVERYYRVAPALVDAIGDDVDVWEAKWSDRSPRVSW